MPHIPIFSQPDNQSRRKPGAQSAWSVYIPASLALIISLTTILAFSGPTWAQSANPHAVSLYNLGLTAYRQGSPESAIIFFRRATDIDPDLADAQYNLGILFQSQRRIKEAIPRFQEVLRIKPQDQDAHYQLGLAYADSNSPDDARRELLSIAPNNPHFAEAQRRLNLLGSPPVQTTQTQTTQTTQTTTQPVNNLPATPAEATQTITATESVTRQVTPTQTTVQTASSVNTTPANTQPVATPAVNPQPVQTIAAAQAPVAAPNTVSTTLPNAATTVIATGFSAPSGIAIDKHGTLYVANFGTNSIDRISNGNKSLFVSGVSLKGPIGLTIDDSGNLYVANYSSGNIVRVTPAGIMSIIGTGFKKPYYLALDHAGNLFVSQQEDNSVARITLPANTNNSNTHQH